MYNLNSLKIAILSMLALFFVVPSAVSKEANELKNDKDIGLHQKIQEESNDSSVSYETSVDLTKLRKAESLKELYKLAGDMHIGTANDQKALTKAVSDYILNLEIRRPLSLMSEGKGVQDKNTWRCGPNCW